MHENIMLRLANTPDLPFLADLKLTNEKMSPFITRTLRTPEEEMAYLTETSKRCTITIATISGQIVGFSAMNGDYMEQLFVHPNFQGKGVGSMLLLNEQKTRKAMSLAVIRENVNAINFYVSHGFIFEHEIPNSNANHYAWHRY